MRKFLLPLCMIVLFSFQGRAQMQEDRDSLVRLLSAASMEQVERGGENYRKVIGPARFFHNNTYLICDTAFWNMNTSVIECISNVSIIQEDTKLTSDKLIYLVDDDLAQFRGTLVQLEDKDGNVLRTRHLDYNTRDSVATFLNGGAMRDKDGQIIESRTGSYDSRDKLFSFVGDVNMFTDSIFIKTSTLDYHSDSGMAVFGTGTDAWKEENMLSSDAGWYDRQRELFLFRRKVHGMNNTQEAWADSLYFHRMTREVELLGNAQITDTTRNTFSMGGRMHYVDSVSCLTLTRDPVVIGITQGEKPDTVYARADVMVYYTVPMCDVSPELISVSLSRLKDVNSDAVAEYRRKAAEAAAQAAEDARKGDPNAAQKRDARGLDASEEEGPSKTPAGTPSVPPPADDSLSSLPPADSLSQLPPADSLALGLADSLDVKGPVDSTKIGFMRAFGNFKLFKKDLQIVCDSLEYTDLDSLVRLYRRPLLWNDKRRQYSSDSLFAVIKGGALDKASLMSEAFVIIQEDSLCFDQVRSVEMMAYFDSTGALSRFDALGDANAIFYIQEDSTYATVNFSKSKILSAGFKDGEIDRVHYFDDAKSDAYPVAQIKQEQRSLKGFSWSPGLRPDSPSDITDRTLRQSQRLSYAARPKARFVNTDIYFPGYMEEVRENIEAARLAREMRRAEQREREAFLRDSLNSVSEIDSLTARDSVVIKDSLSVGNAASVRDSLSLKDSLSAASSLNAQDTSAAETPLTPEELSARRAEQRRLEREARERERQEQKAREWARLDSLDNARAAEKAALKAAKARRKKLKAYERLMRQQAEEEALLQKYIEYYRRRKEAEEETRQLEQAGAKILETSAEE